MATKFERCYPVSETLCGLDWSDVKFSGKTKQRFAREAQSIRRFLEQNLPRFAELGELGVLNLREGDHAEPPIWFDARSSPVKLLDSAPADTPTINLTLSPEHIEDLIQGAPHRDVALEANKGTDKSRPTLGEIRFLDLLTPDPSVPPVPAHELNHDELPKPTEDIQQIKDDLKKWGYGIFKNAIPPRQLEILKTACLEQAAGERKAGVATFDGGPNKPNQRVWNLINKGDEFIDLLNHPMIDELVPWYLNCVNPTLYTFALNIARPGGIPQVLHMDQGGTARGRSMAVGINISWLLCDFNEENGGTRIFPGSHKGNIRPKDLYSSEGSIACVAPAGSALIFEGRLWHGTGKSKAATGERPCILSMFTHPSLRPKENPWLGLSWETEERLPYRQKGMCGLATGIAGSYGAGGEAEEHKLIVRPRGEEHRPLGRLRAPNDMEELYKTLARPDHANTPQTIVREMNGIDI